MDVRIQSETGTLKRVILGSAVDFGGVPKLEETYDPWSKFHIQAKSFPKEADLCDSMERFAEILKRHGVEVLRPKNISGLNQIFMRDIGFVIDDTFVISHVIEERAEEIKGIEYVIDQIPKDKILQVPEDAHVEGGDVLVTPGHLFVGYSGPEDYATYKTARTNQAGIDFLIEHFPEYTVHPLELVKSDKEPRSNVLHLDCCFQPVGDKYALISSKGFKHYEDYQMICEHFGNEHIIDLSHGQMARLFTNLFSISPTVVVSDYSFEPLNTMLEERGITVEKVNYKEVRKMSGLFRCSTLPLLRSS